jgi:hypothetical protein
LLTDLLLDTLKRTAQQTGTEGRIVCLSSLAHIAPYKEGIRFDKLDSKEGLAPRQHPCSYFCILLPHLLVQLRTPLL